MRKEMSKEMSNRQSVWLVCSVVFVYSVLAWLLSLAWLKGDDFFFVCDEMFCSSKIYGAIHCYLNHVSRFGEILGRLCGLAANRWQHWIITPLMLVLAPFVIRRIFCKNEEVAPSRVLIFFWFAAFLMLQSVYMGHGSWRNFWCYAAAVNYFWSTVITFIFLMLISPVQWPWLQAGGMRCVGLCLLCFGVGCCSGWGTESMSVILIPLITLYLLICLVKKIRIPRPVWAGYLGLLWGGFLLLCSPALGRRSANEAVTRALDVSSMTSEQITDFVQHLTPEKVSMLMGSSGVVNLTGIPIIQHLYFLPMLSEKYWGCCWFPSVVLLVLSALYVVVRPVGWARMLGVVWGMYAISWCCACSYLAGAIPGEMSFLPACFIVVLACSLMFLKLQGRGSNRALTILTLLIVGVGVYRFVPAGVEACQYKKYEDSRFAEIARQKAAGCTEIVLPPFAWEKAPIDTLGLIRSMDMGPNPQAYPNSLVRHYFGVDAISQKKPAPQDK